MTRTARRFTLILTLTLTAFAASAVNAQLGQHMTAYAELLSKYVVISPDGLNRVAYARWHGSQADRQKLEAVIGSMVSQKPSAMTRDDAFAFWANLYNAVTLKVILDNYPVKSIRDIKSTGTGLFDIKSYIGPWRTKRVDVEGRELSLDDIENAILRPRFKDPRVHYSINCASLGCPNLQPKPWSGASLSADLDAAASAYINDPRGVAVGANGTVTVSSIYNWFQGDFGGSKAGVFTHLRKFASPELAAKLKDKASYRDDYDWGLNEAR